MIYMFQFSEEVETGIDNYLESSKFYKNSFQYKLREYLRKWSELVLSQKFIKREEEYARLTCFT